MARVVSVCFLISTASAIGLATVYWRGGQPQLEGVLLAASFGALGAGFVVWAHHLLPSEQHTEDASAPANDDRGTRRVRRGSRTGRGRRAAPLPPRRARERVRRDRRRARVPDSIARAAPRERVEPHTMASGNARRDERRETRVGVGGADRRARDRLPRGSPRLSRRSSCVGAGRSRGPARTEERHRLGSAGIDRVLEGLHARRLSRRPVPGVDPIAPLPVPPVGVCGARRSAPDIGSRRPAAPAASTDDRWRRCRPCPWRLLVADRSAHMELTMKDRRHESVIVLTAISVVVLAACGRSGSESQSPSMLNPKGTEASHIAGVWWLMFAIAAGVYLVVGGFIVYAVVRGRKANAPDPNEPAPAALRRSHDHVGRCRGSSADPVRARRRHGAHDQRTAQTRTERAAHRRRRRAVVVGRDVPVDPLHDGERHPHSCRDRRSRSTSRRTT